MRWQSMCSLVDAVQWLSIFYRFATILQLAQLSETSRRTRTHSVKDIHSLTAEAQHLIIQTQMLSYSPTCSKRPSRHGLSPKSTPNVLELVTEDYILGRDGGLRAAATQAQEREVPFVEDLGREMDMALGGPYMYNENGPAGPSWARVLDPRYPLAGANNDG